ncbi:cyclin-dependent serine/threonine-protein kinase [Biomphalaria glabrata]|nr:putative cyclin-dependent serine/threonine-protein kinase [Biomphalaria glabrata]
MDFGMSPVVLVFAVLMFVVSADELVLQLNGELGSYPESMILTKIQMGVIDPTPIVNERGLRYFVQIARNNVVVYPNGVQTIVPIGRKRYHSQRLVPINNNRLRCTSCDANKLGQIRTTPPPSSLSQKSASRNIRPSSASLGEFSNSKNLESRQQTATAADRQGQTMKTATNQSKQADAAVPQENRRVLMDVLKSGTPELKVSSQSITLQARRTQSVTGQVQNIAESVDVVRSSRVSSFEGQGSLQNSEMHYQLQRLQNLGLRDQNQQIQGRLQSPLDLSQQQPLDKLQKPRDEQLQRQSRDQLQQQPQDRFILQAPEKPQIQLHQSHDQPQQPSHDQFQLPSQDKSSSKPQQPSHDQIQLTSQDRSLSQLQQQSHDQLHQPHDQTNSQLHERILKQPQEQIHQMSVPLQLLPIRVESQQNNSTLAATTSTTSQPSTETSPTPLEMSTPTTTSDTNADSQNIQGSSD